VGKHKNKKKKKRKKKKKKKNVTKQYSKLGNILNTIHFEK